VLRRRSRAVAQHTDRVGVTNNLAAKASQAANNAVDGTVPLLKMRGIAKQFAGVYAIRDVDLTLSRGEVLGLLGENGAGKTTLMNVLFGIYTPDAGSIHVHDRAVALGNPADALATGIGMVHQHFHLVPRHTVLENIMVGSPGRYGLLDTRRAQGRLDEISSRYGLSIDSAQRVEELTVGEQQRLEIIKALYHQAQVLILDEPTSVLTPQQSEGLFEAVRTMANNGVGVVFISHKLKEVLTITQRIMVMRRGSVVANLANDDTLTPVHLAQLMCGREIEPPKRVATPAGRVLLRLSNITVRRRGMQRDQLSGVTMDVRAGEIVGVAGVSGNGQRELAGVIAGTISPSSGTLEVDGARVRNATPRSMQRLGVAQIPEDRIGAGLLSNLPLSDSVVLPRFHTAPFSRLGWLKRGAIRKFVTDQMQNFDIRAAGTEARTGTLSGGNLQKALLARELAFHPVVLVAAQPTRGLDVAGVEFVHQQILDLKTNARGVVLISEDLEELFALADRIVVIYEGRLVADLAASQATVTDVGMLMAGGSGGEAAE